MATANEGLHGVDGDTRRVSADRVFFGGMALVCAVTILGGFTPSFYLRDALLPAAAPLRPVVVAHGVVFTAWVVLFLAQTALIGARRREPHRRLGCLALVIVAAMAAVGVPLIAGFERGHGVEPPLTLAVHLLANVAPLVLFVGFALAGVAWRARSDVHKRLMLFATLALQPAGFARLIGYLGIGPAANVPCYAVLCLAVPVYDLCVDQRVRTVSWLGAALLFGEVYVTDRLFAYIES